MKTIKLHGDLGEKFGAEWTLDAASPGEALRLINANAPTFLAYMRESGNQGVSYRLVVGEQDIDVDEINRSCNAEVLHLVPVAAGAKKGGIGSILIGAALIVGSVISMGGVTAAFSAMSAGTAGFAGTAFSLGTSLVVGGISQALAGTPAAPEVAGEQKTSTGFGGVGLSAAQGAGIPVGYGEMMITEPLLISNGLEAESVL
jgi:predicted phage tail protein